MNMVDYYTNLPLNLYIIQVSHIFIALLPAWCLHFQFKTQVPPLKNRGVAPVWLAGEIPISFKLPEDCAIDAEEDQELDKI